MHVLLEYREWEREKNCLKLITQTVHVGNCLTFIEISLGKVKLSQILNTSKDGLSKVKTKRNFQMLSCATA